MIYDRIITISTGSSRMSIDWRPQTMRLSELYEKLRNPARSTETMADFMGLQKNQQDKLKDIGGFVAGSLNGPRRKAGAVTGRDLLALDLDNIPSGMTENVCARVESTGCGYCIYSTRKHRPDAPRLRILFPLDRTCTADEYEPIGRYVMNQIGLELADPTTFEAHRLMYWPSVCADGQYVFYYADKPMLSVDGVLAAYADWHDTTSWPRLPGEVNHRKMATKQGDPTEKKGIVGAFCRTYDVPAAMDKFLPGVYEETASTGRYTYTGGSTTGGAILYDDGKFLYSHHATDPTSNRLVNAFDLVRLHKFGDLDDKAEPGTPTVRMPSFTEMCKLAAADDTVAGLLLREQREARENAFSPITMDTEDSDEPEDDPNWEIKLQRHERTGLPLPTIDNIWLILEHDPNLKGRFALNEFAGRGEVLKQLPWSKQTDRRFWDDNDIAGINWYMEKYYQITKRGNIDSALSLHGDKYSFNEVADYLNSLEWDGIARLDTLFIDYLGAADTEYIRAVTRKAFTAAVTRAMRPGTKFDEMTILSGPQGIGKSTLLDKMSKGWFNDSIRTFEGKEASELLQGVWLVEVSELDAFRHSDDARIKQFLSQRVDRFRAAYGRHVKDLPRRCVFFGTTNRGDYLRDRTGNRRYWSVDVGVQPHNKNVWRDLEGERDQLWAEARFRWQMGETLYLPDELKEEAQRQQEEHREVSVREGLILDFLEKLVPYDWQTWPLDRRRLYWNGSIQDADKLQLVQRDRICALEIWCELFHGYEKDMKREDTTEINSIIEASPSWKKTKNGLRFGPYGLHRGFLRDIDA
ncbi:MAG: virulence-associated protein E [Oscillibacter sp.]|nr:virulence-associated protein E [Oscillibacter sp.]